MLDICVRFLPDLETDAKYIKLCQSFDTYTQTKYVATLLEQDILELPPTNEALLRDLSAISQAVK